jgi:putative phage-type endonuclease
MTVLSDLEITLPHFPDAILVGPPNTPEEEWLAWRKGGVCGSDVAALIGADQRRDALQVFVEKTTDWKRPVDAKLDRAARRGKKLESLIAEIFGEETGYPVLGPPGLLQHKKFPWARATLDGTVLDPHCAVLECKSRNWRSGLAEGWRGKEPPDGPTIQACWYMLVTGLRRAYVAGLVDDDFHSFVIERDDEFLRHLTIVAERFYREHLLTGRPPKPSGQKSTVELLSHLWDIKPGTIKVFDPDEVLEIRTERRALQEEIKKKEEEVNKLTSQLKMLLGDAEEATGPDGTTLFSWKAEGNFAQARFCKELPHTAAEYMTTKTVLDVERIKTEEPALYAAYRARVFRDGSSL